MTNDQAHQEFLNFAQSMSALNFAAQKYLELQKIIGVDDLTEMYLRQIELRLESVANNFVSLEKDKQLGLKSFQKNLFRFEYSFRNILLIISFVAVFFFALNVMRPVFPVLNGLLIAVVVLSTALWAISKNHTKPF